MAPQLLRRRLQHVISVSGIVALIGLCGCGDDGGQKPDKDPPVPSAVDTPDAPQPAATHNETPEDPAALADQDTRPPISHAEPVDAADTESSPTPETQTPDENPPADHTKTAEGELIATATPSVSAPSDAEDDASLDQRLAKLEIPPAWLADVETAYDTSTPWKDARLEIRRLLGLGKPESHREAIKLTWVYYQNKMMGDGHEYPMYTFLGGEPLWSVRAHEWYLAQPHEHTPIHSYITLAKILASYGEFERAKSQLDIAAQNLPEPPWKTMREADIAAAYGDLYAAWNQPEEAKRHYAQAIRIYPTAKPPYGRHLLPRRAAAVQAKLDLLVFRSLQTANLKDGKYQDRALGYAGDIHVTVTVENGKIADIKLRHEEKIDQNACVVIPQRIIDGQSLQVDGISGATVTKDAIVGGVYRCLNKAGLQ
jgi:uncharacterized protein with FMN-binding domain